MLKLTITIIAGVGLSIISAFLGLRDNEKNASDEKNIQAVAAFTESAGRSLAHDSGAHFVPLAMKEKDAVVTLQITNKQFSPIELYVTDTEGNRVRTLIQKHLSAGIYRISWYGETDLTAPLTPGLYFLILDSNDSRQMLKVVME